MMAHIHRSCHKEEKRGREGDNEPLPSERELAGFPCGGFGSTLGGVENGKALSRHQPPSRAVYDVTNEQFKQRRELAGPAHRV